MTEIAHTPVEPTEERAGSDNPFVGAVGRIPLSLRAKLLIGFGVVGALLAIGYGLGFVALGRSNARGTQLRRLQQDAANARVLENKANLLSELVGTRRNDLSGALNVYRSENAAVLLVSSQLGEDDLVPHTPPRLRATVNAFNKAWGTVVVDDYTLKGDHSQSLASSLDRAATLVGQAYQQAEAFANATKAKTDALVAADQSSFDNSRNLLIGVGLGSLALAVALALLLSSSVVMPLRRTRTRLAAIAARDFSTPVEVPNRDEIGGLAADVNSMSDELQRVYRELETASKHKSDFLANMSHELRTPLNAVIGFSEILHEQMFGELNERQLAYVDDIRAAGQHQLSLINDVLDLAKIEAGRMELELSEVSLPVVLRSAVSMHAERAKQAGIELGLKTEPEEITITADERRVRQVVFNLLSNAVKFTPPQGRIDVSARAENGQVEVAVADTGPGIPAADLDTIFEEFEQTDAGKQVEGTGLGLPLSRKLVELHGGRLWAESEPGHGSTFRFTLPRLQEVP
jgi:signal transduction histidine kinase